MKKILILYKSKYGASKQYGELLKKELDSTVMNIKDYHPGDEKSYDVIIFVSGIYAGNITIVKEVKKYFANFKDKKKIIFAVGLSKKDPALLEEIERQNLSGDLNNIDLFYGRGNYDESKLSFVDRTLCKTMKKVLKNKDRDSLELTMKALLEIEGQKVNYVDNHYLIPLLELIKSMV